MSLRTVVCPLLLVCSFWHVAARADDAADPSASESQATTYTLRYKFQPGEVMRWKVVHQALVRTTVSGTTQTAETRSESIKVWQVNQVDAETGRATFVHSVDSVDMRQSVSGRQDVRFNSLTDAVVPAEFEEVAKAVGVPLSVIVLDNQGHVINRHEERPQPNANPGRDDRASAGEAGCGRRELVIAARRQRETKGRYHKAGQNAARIHVDRG
jgi:hypothetical protein